MATKAGVHAVSFKTNSDGNQNEGYANDSGTVTIQVSRSVDDKRRDEVASNDNMPLAMISALFCNIILGGIAIWKSLQVKRYANQGDFDSAKNAYVWTIFLSALSLLTGGAGWIIAFRFWITEDY